MALTVTSNTVQLIYGMYTKDTLKINRRYQRKLVWSIEEKQAFIDSLIKGYPIPLIMVSKNQLDDSFEVLDGLQRLNAITSFMEGDFPVNDKWFDFNAITYTKPLSENKQQKTPLLNPDDLDNFLNYPIPFGVTDYYDNDFIDETFRRINTRGKQLSRQDVRQAGALGTISDVINNIAMYVRKDSSQSNILTLKSIKNISIAEKELNYGIDISEIFWVKHGVIIKNDIKKSRDEELIAHLVSYAALQDKASTTSKYLDAIYDLNTEEYKLLTNKIETIGAENIIKSINFIFDEFSKIFKDDTFVKTIYRGDKHLKSPSTFQIVFCALYDLIINENMYINNYRSLYTAFNNIADHYAKITESDKKWSIKDRHDLIKATKGIISSNFSENTNSKFTPQTWVKNLENIINESLCEQNYFDFKIGFLNLDDEKLFNDSLVKKVLKTLIAMTNTVHEECMVIIGVADTENDVTQYKKIHQSSYPTIYRNKYITGIQDEAKNLFPNGTTSEAVEKYIKKIKDIISNDSNASKQFREQVAQKIIHFSYKEKEMIVFRATRGDIPEFYNKRLYVRHVSDNQELEPGSAPYMDKFKEFKLLM